MDNPMLHRILKKLSGRASNKSYFELNFQKRVKEQHDDLPKAGYIPIPEKILKNSDNRYLDPSHRSLRFACLNLQNQNMIFPVRALYAMGATLMSYNQLHPNPSLMIEDICQFRLAAMEAALNCTPDDLLVLLTHLDALPCVESWEQSYEWRTRNFPEEEVSRWHSLNRHAAALFLKRIDTPEADFIAFKEAAEVLNGLEFFSVETCEHGEANVQLGHVIADIFPTLRARESSLLERRSRLIYRTEDESSPVVPEDKIGVDGFS